MRQDAAEALEFAGVLSVAGLKGRFRQLDNFLVAPPGLESAGQVERSQHERDRDGTRQVPCFSAERTKCRRAGEEAVGMIGASRITARQASRGLLDRLVTSVSCSSRDGGSGRRGAREAPR